MFIRYSSRNEKRTISLKHTLHVILTNNVLGEKWYKIKIQMFIAIMALDYEQMVSIQRYLKKHSTWKVKELKMML